MMDSYVRAESCDIKTIQHTKRI